MPLIRVEMLPGRSREQKRELAQVFTQEMARICKVSAEAITIVIEEISPDHWATGGRLQSDKNIPAAATQPATAPATFEKQ